MTTRVRKRVSFWGVAGKIRLPAENQQGQFPTANAGSGVAAVKEEGSVPRRP